MALGLHAGLGFGAHEIAKRVEHETPVRLKRFLVNKQQMKEILERIKAMREENDEIDYLEIALQEKLEALEEVIEAIPEPETEAGAHDGEMELDTGYDDAAYLAQLEEPEEGEAGDPESQLEGNRYGVKGPEDNPDPHIARQAALRDTAEFGMIGLLASAGDPDAPTSPDGLDTSLGNAPLSARGNMWGDSIGESFGAGGLGLKGSGPGAGGIGDGGGGTGEGIGLGSIGTIGHGAGTGTGQGFGGGRGRIGRAKPTRSARAPSKATATVNVKRPRKGATKGEETKKVPRVHIRNVSVRGVRKSTAKRVLRSKRSALSRCHRGKDGWATLRIGIDASGHVVIGKRSEAILSTRSESTANCVLSTVSSVKFPEPKDGATTLTFTVTLKSPK